MHTLPAPDTARAPLIMALERFQAIPEQRGRWAQDKEACGQDGWLHLVQKDTKASRHC